MTTYNEVIETYLKFQNALIQNEHLVEVVKSGFSEEITINDANYGHPPFVISDGRYAYVLITKDFHMERLPLFYGINDNFLAKNNHTIFSTPHNDGTENVELIEFLPVDENYDFSTVPYYDGNFSSVFSSVLSSYEDLTKKIINSILDDGLLTDTLARTAHPVYAQIKEQYGEDEKQMELWESHDGHEIMCQIMTASFHLIEDSLKRILLNIVDDEVE